MQDDQQVSKKVYELDFTVMVDNKELTDNHFKLTPNPTATTFKLGANGLFAIKVYSSTGIEVLQKQVNGEEFIDITQLQSGIYFVQIFLDQKLRTIEHLIIH